MIQKIIDIFYRIPKSYYLHYDKFGGYFNLKKIERNRQEMERNSLNLPPVKSYEDGLPIYFLTGKKYLYQTLFCIQSLNQVSPEKFKFYIVDDGSFQKHDFILIQKMLPNCVIYDKSTIEKKLCEILPLENFPYLNYKRKVYPHIKKITDIHIFSENEWKLVLDSDMLFWKNPIDIIEWLKSPQNPLYMLDCQESYGYTKKLMESLIQEKIQPLINVGVIGMASQSINWNNLEKWCINLEKAEQTTYFLEQALSAMLIGSKESTILNTNNYVVNPKQISEFDVLHHYVDTSKEIYFKQAWRKIIELN